MDHRFVLVPRVGPTGRRLRLRVEVRTDGYGWVDVETWTCRVPRRLAATDVAALVVRQGRERGWLLSLDGWDPAGSERCVVPVRPAPPAG